MSEAEYTERLKIIDSTYHEAKTKLFSEYALSQAKFKIGDIIKGLTGTLLIDRITVYKGLDAPIPVYSGFELNKDLSLKKKGNKLSIYGNNNVELINR